MSRTRSSAKARLIDAALDLFSSQGYAGTTTRQIAEFARVNEVTLFRHFGSKQGLLLAAIEDSGVFTHLEESLRELANRTGNLDEGVKQYAGDRLQALEKVPELLRSVIGEAGHYTVENRQMLGRGVAGANRDVARYLAGIIERDRLQSRLPVEKLASLLNGMLFGYLVIELTSEYHELWGDRQDFLDSLVTVYLQGAVCGKEEETSGSDRLAASSKKAVARSTHQIIVDLPASVVRSILQQAKKQGPQEYAIAYVLFAAGLLPQEVVALERSHRIVDPHQHLLQVTRGAVRQVPVNQWIVGKRYGSHTNNPLSQWLKSRKDEQSAIFINDAVQPISEEQLKAVWQKFTVGLLTPQSQPLSIEQARQTWCVEMLMKGIEIEDLSILSGWDATQLQPYARRAREKAALERAIHLDRSNS